MKQSIEFQIQAQTHAQIETARVAEAKKNQLRFELLEQATSDLHQGQKQLISQLCFGIYSERSETFISNGLLNYDSYLDAALQGEPLSLAVLKETYQEDALYFLFEKLFRGSELEISRRQSFYLSYIRTCFDQLSKNNPRGYFLDFGSGRGEFLTLLNENKIPGTGVDTNRLNFDRAIKKRLTVHCEDGLKFLKNLDDQFLFGLTSFQVAEHLDYEVLKELVSLAYQKIQPGGVLILETINPLCDAAMRTFYLDPTHIRPYPPETLRFLCEWIGFKNIKIVYYLPVAKQLPETDTSNYVGYALVGYR